MREQFTPGPWLVHSSHRLIVPAEDAFKPVSRDANKVTGDDAEMPKSLCLIADPRNDLSEDETYGNAFLIAAAPELYRYLELALGVLDRANVAWGGEPGARAALAKARGEQ